MLIPIPAIDLIGGNVVRLVQGDFEKVTVYDETPQAVAKRFESQGAARLHVVDLEGARTGIPKNQQELAAILKAVKVPVEIGGGIRSLKTAERYLDMGARWVIFGSKPCLDEGFAREAAQAFGHKVIVGIDARDGFVATDGWTNVTGIKAVTMAKRMHAVGVSTIIYTDISKDGAMTGPNVEAVEQLAGAVPVDVIASGGVTSLKDLAALTALRSKNLAGVIIGKALYEGRFTLKEAIKRCLQSA